MGTETPITPVFVGDEGKAQEMEKMLWDAGVYAIAIVYPTVARGKARIRTMPTAVHTEEQFARALSAFKQAGETLRLI